jgi:hypothetical protein
MHNGVPEPHRPSSPIGCDSNVAIPPLSVEGSVHSDHDTGGFNHGIGFTANLQLQVLERIKRDDGNDR